MIKRIFSALMIVSILIILSCAKADSPFSPQTASMQITKEYYVYGEIKDVEITDNYIYTAENYAGISIYDRKSGDLVVHTDSIGYKLNKITEIEVNEAVNLLFAYDQGDGQTIEKIDISDLSSLSIPLHYIGHTGDIRDYYTFLENNEVQVFSTRLQEFRYGNFGEISYTSDAIEIGTKTRDFIIGDSLIYIAGDQKGICILDKENKTILDFIDTPGEAVDVEVSGNFIFVADRQDGLQVIDYSNKTNPQITYSFDTYGYAQSLDISGNYLAVASGGGGVYLFDVSDPKLITLAHSLNSDEVGYVYEVTFFNDILYVSSRDKGVLEIEID